MGKDPKITTTISTKGQVVLPAAVRKRHGWSEGTKLLVEETAHGVLLKSRSPFPQTRPEDVFGCANYSGSPISIEAMDKAIDREAKRRHARGEY